MSIKKTYFSEALIGEEAKKKLGLIIKDGAITTNKMKDNTVTTYKIVDRAVTEPKLADNSVSERTIQMSAVSHDKLAIGAVDKENIRDNAVTTRTIEKQAVTHDKMAEGAVGSENIMADAIKEEHIASNAVSTDELQDGSVTLRKLAHDATDVIDGFRTELNALKVKHDKDIQKTLTEALNAAKDAKENPVIKDIVSEQIKDGEVKTVDICDGAVTTEKIAAGAVSTDEIQDGCITFEKLSPDLMKKLLEQVATIKVEGQVAFMHNYTGKELPEPKSAGLYAYSDNILYKSDGVGTYTWNRNASEAGKIYVDEDTAQSYVSDGQGNLLRLDKENSDLSFEVVG